MTWRLRCWKARRTLFGARPGALAPAERGRLQAHLDGCVACRRIADRLGALDRVLQAGPGGQAVDLWPAVRAEIARRAPERPARQRAAWVPAAGAVAAVLVALAV